MDDRNTITVVAPDTGLRRSLAFALEAEGFVVESFVDLVAAKASMQTADCAVVDARVLKTEEDVWLSLGKLRRKAILLTTGITSYADRGAAAELSTPFNGNELIELLDHLPGP
ncbi:transcriptional regulator [Rhizobium sp. LjRoot30]|uniref:transcriptional regulator n=1 Tax=Rhizobium sp. LjRoot30 TaxID=3342320 RepID=UPI003ED0951F